MVNKKPSELKSHIGYRLRAVSNAVSHSFARKLITSEVTVAEWVILREMYDKSEIISSSMIAELTGLTRGAVSKLVDRLVRKNLIIRTESTADRRFLRIELSSKAKELVPALAAIADENDEAFFSSLSKKEQKILMDILIKLSEIHQLNTSPIQ
ncbi:MAG: MarR family transcriptional regulator [Neisseriales bacterium]|nr:MAG: MarR family transcriptional regulator [Neisseriales bacterium]